MPIANCYITKVKISHARLDALTKEWAETIDVDLKDICLTFINASFQTGRQYKVVVNLFLPSIWSKSSIDNIQTSLLNLIIKHLNLKAADVFIITTIVQSGNVVENGNVVKWRK